MCERMRACVFQTEFARILYSFLSDEDIRFTYTRHVFEDFHIVASELECRAVHHICQLVSTRAATMAAIGKLAYFHKCQL